MNNRNKWLSIFCCFCVLLFLMFYRNPERHIDMHIGVFVGSNFEVYNDNSMATLDKAISLFEEKHPNVDIKYESGIQKSDYSNWLSQELLEGEKLDAYMVLDSDLNVLMNMNALEDLTPYISTSSLDNMCPSVLKQVSLNDKLYALPYAISPMMMCVNQDLLDKEGIEIPKYWTIDDFYDICEKVTKDLDGDGDIDQYGSYNFDWKNVLDCYGLSLFSRDGESSNINDDVKKSLQMAEKLKALNNHINVTKEDFDSGKVAFCPMSIAEYRTYQPYPYRISNYTNFSWKCINMPESESNTNSTSARCSMMAISSKSKNKKLAFEFISLLTENETLQKSVVEDNKGMSVLKSVVNSTYMNSILEQEGLEITTDQIDYVLNHLVNRPKFKRYEEVREYADSLVEQSLEENTLEMDLPTIIEKLNTKLK